MRKLGIDAPTPAHHWLKAAPGSVNSLVICNSVHLGEPLEEKQEELGVWMGTLRVEEGGKAEPLYCTDEETGPEMWGHFPAGDQVSIGPCCVLHKDDRRSLCSEGCQACRAHPCPVALLDGILPPQHQPCRTLRGLGANICPALSAAHGAQ